jgi:hypothetical protein
LITEEDLDDMEQEKYKHDKLLINAEEKRASWKDDKLIPSGRRRYFL